MSSVLVVHLTLVLKEDFMSDLRTQCFIDSPVDDADDGVVDDGCGVGRA